MEVHMDPIIVVLVVDMAAALTGVAMATSALLKVRELKVNLQTALASPRPVPQMAVLEANPVPPAHEVKSECADMGISLANRMERIQRKDGKRTLTSSDKMRIAVEYSQEQSKNRGHPVGAAEMRNLIEVRLELASSRPPVHAPAVVPAVAPVVAPVVAPKK
jgi:hypothetical protein